LSPKTLDVFVAVVDCGSITRAAEQLGITQPAVSTSIRELETILGDDLIDRSTRPLSATRTGLELYKRSVHLLAEMDRMVVAVTSASGKTMPSLRLGAAGPMMGSTWIFELQALTDELQVSGGLSTDLQKALLAHQVDAAVLSDHPMYETPGLERRFLLDEPYLLVLPSISEKKWHNARFRVMAETFPLVRYSSRTTIGKSVDLYLRRCGLELKRRLEFESSSTVLEMVQAELGWTIATPLCIAESRVDLNTIVLKPLPIAPAPRKLHLLNFAGELPMADKVRDVLANSLKTMLTHSFQGQHDWVLKQISFDEDRSVIRANMTL
jgi:DNA-binding transcriptional LysR family regulator